MQALDHWKAMIQRNKTSLAMGPDFRLWFVSQLVDYGFGLAMCYTMTIYGWGDVPPLERPGYNTGLLRSPFRVTWPWRCCT